MEREFYIIRHGQTNLNQQKIVQGSGIDSALNSTGQAQAQQFYEKYKHVHFDHVYISALKRTYQTVEPFINAGLPYTIMPQLNEISWGTYENTYYGSDKPNQVMELTAAWDKGYLDIKAPGGESAREAADRLNEAIQLLGAPGPAKRVLVCMHGRVMRMLMCLLTQQPLSNMYKFPHTNTSLYIVRLNVNGFKIHQANSIIHLNK